jgi:hypothetical protein
MQEHIHTLKKAKTTENRRDRNKEWRKEDHNKTKEEGYRNVTILKELDIRSDMVTVATCRAFGFAEESLLHFSRPPDSPSVCLLKINVEIQGVSLCSP